MKRKSHQDKHTVQMWIIDESVLLLDICYEAGYFNTKFGCLCHVVKPCLNGYVKKKKCLDPRNAPKQYRNGCGQKLVCLWIWTTPWKSSTWTNLWIQTSLNKNALHWRELQQVSPILFQAEYCYFLPGANIFGNSGAFFFLQKGLHFRKINIVLTSHHTAFL